MTYTVNCSILLTELPLLERPAAAKAAGFDAVEFWWPFETSVPSDAEVSRFERAITDAGVQLTGLNFNAGDMPGGDRGLVSWPCRSAEFMDNIDVVAGSASDWAARRSTPCTATASRGNLPKNRTHWRREPRRRRRRCRPDRRNRTAGACQRSTPVSAADRRRCSERDRPGQGRNRRGEHQAPRGLLPSGGQR